MPPFIAIILVCLHTVVPAACSEATAVDVMSIGAESELTCTSGWQDVVARSAFADRIGTDAYVRRLCKRRPAAAAAIAE